MEFSSDHPFYELVSEARELADSRPFCHHTQNDLFSLFLMAQLCEQGDGSERQRAEGCLCRIRIAARTGEYPDHLLPLPKSSVLASTPPTPGPPPEGERANGEEQPTGRFWE